MEIREEEGVAGCETGRRGRETERREEWKGRYKWRRVKLTLLPQSVQGSAHSCTQKHTLL